MSTIHLAEGSSSFGYCEHGNDILDSMADMEYVFDSQGGLWSVRVLLVVRPWYVPTPDQP